MDHEFLNFLQLLSILIPILSAKGLVDKVLHLIIRSRQQQQEVCKLLSEDPIVFDGRRNFDDLPNILSNRSCSPTFCCVNSEKCPEYLNRFVEQVFATMSLRSLPIIISSGVFKDPISCDLHSIVLEDVDTRTFRGIDLDCVPDYKCINSVFEILDKNEAKQSSCLIYYSLTIFREYLKKNGMEEGEATGIMDTLLRNYGTGIHTGYFRDYCEEFIYLFKRWMKAYGNTIDISIPIGSDLHEVKNGVFCDGRYLFLSKNTLDGVIAPMLSEVRRRDLLMALSQEKILVRSNSEDFISHMRYFYGEERKTASMYRFDLHNIEIGDDKYE